MEILSQELISNIRTGKTWFKIRLSDGIVIEQDKPVEFYLVNGKAVYKKTDNGKTQ